MKERAVAVDDVLTITDPPLPRTRARDEWPLDEHLDDEAR